MAMVRGRGGIEVDDQVCMNGPEGCRGKVTLRFSAMGTPNPRCEAHQRKRDKVERQIRTRYEGPRPSDFDPGYAGERWDPDY